MCSLGINAQITSEGTVSFVSSQSTYIKYKSTAGFLIGDTLFTSINNQLIPTLLIKNLSSTSVVCSSISSFKFNINDKIYAKSKVQSKSQEKEKILFCRKRKIFWKKRQRNRHNLENPIPKLLVK